MAEGLRDHIRCVLTDEVIRAVRSLAIERAVCREQDGHVVFVTGIDAAREYIIEMICRADPPDTTPR